MSATLPEASDFTLPPSLQVELMQSHRLLPGEPITECLRPFIEFCAYRPDASAAERVRTFEVVFADLVRDFSSADAVQYSANCVSHALHARPGLLEDLRSHGFQQGNEEHERKLVGYVWGPLCTLAADAAIGLAVRMGTGGYLEAIRSVERLAREHGGPSWGQMLNRAVFLLQREGEFVEESLRRVGFSRTVDAIAATQHVSQGVSDAWSDVPSEVALLLAGLGREEAWQPLERRLRKIRIQASQDQRHRGGLDETEFNRRHKNKLACAAGFEGEASAVLSRGEKMLPSESDPIAEVQALEEKAAFYSALEGLRAKHRFAIKLALDGTDEDEACLRIVAAGHARTCAPKHYKHLVNQGLRSLRSRLRTA